MMAWPSIQKNKASNSAGLLVAGVCQSVGADLSLSQQHNLMSMCASHNDPERDLSSQVSHKCVKGGQRKVPKVGEAVRAVRV
jgi:hypothetical protein